MCEYGLTGVNSDNEAFSSPFGDKYNIINIGQYPALISNMNVNYLASDDDCGSLCDASFNFIGHTKFGIENRNAVINSYDGKVKDTETGLGSFDFGGVMTNYDDCGFDVSSQMY